jgi:hypothetical protein
MVSGVQLGFNSVDRFLVQARDLSSNLFSNPLGYGQSLKYV